jgi:hypothetical protein
MSNRKATFAKRQRETDLKDAQRAKETRRAERRAAPRTTEKGPEIAWDQAVTPMSTTYDVVMSEPTPSRSTDSAD